MLDLGSNDRSVGAGGVDSGLTNIGIDGTFTEEGILLGLTTPDLQIGHFVNDHMDTDRINMHSNIAITVNATPDKVSFVILHEYNPSTYM